MVSEQLQAAAGSVDQARQRVLWALGHVPDDKLAWSPTPTAKSALQILSHLIASNAFFISALAQGAVKDPPAEDAGTLAARQEAIDRLNSGTDALIEAIKGLTEDRANATVPTPFGDTSVQFILRIAGIHTFGHAAQIEYLQSCWGDTDFHWTD
jgi:uncharacterized damage-inducible protein DinB